LDQRNGNIKRHFDFGSDQQVFYRKTDLKFRRQFEKLVIEVRILNICKNRWKAAQVEWKQADIVYCTGWLQ